MQPKVYFADSIIEEASKVWKDALVVKLSGKSIGFSTLKAKLTTIWKLRVGFDIMSAGNEYYMLKFDLPEDKS